SHLQKEFAFFTDNSEYNKGFSAALKKYYSHAPYSDDTKLVAKNSAIYVYEYGIKRLKEHNPQCDIVLILRNPVERTYSSYLMEKNYGDVPFSFTDIPALIQMPDSNPNKAFFECLIEYSIYVNHIKSIYRHFRKEQLHILMYEDLANESAKLCRDLFAKLNIDSSFRPDVNVRHNETKKTHSPAYARMLNYFLKNNNPVKRTVKLFVREHNAYKYGEMLRGFNKTRQNHDVIDPATKKVLTQYYKPFNRELELLLGKDLSHWNN
ncbi:MAG: sulfotransferase domain-containing protein, partial [Bacteroidia bacterium]